MMKVAYMFDQILPSIQTESMQPVNALSGLSNIGCDCTLFIPASNVEELPTVETIMDFYNVNGRFKVENVHSIFPGPRMPQKVIHPLVCATMLHKKLAGFDVLYSRNIPAVMAGILSGIPSVLDTYRPWPYQYHQAVLHVLRPMFKSKYFLGMTSHSDYVRDAFIEAGFDPEKLCTAHNGFVKAHYEPVLSRQEARAKLGLPQDAKIATYSGRFDMKKGLDHILLLAEARPDVTFICIGGGYELGVEVEFEVEARKHPNIILTGWMKYNKIPEYLYASDVLIIPPSTGPLKKAGHTVLPIKVYNYIAAGRAIYAPVSPDTEEIFKHDINSWLVEPDHPEAEIAGFNRLIDDVELMDRLGHTAAEQAESLTWEARAKVFCDFVNRRREAAGFSRAD